MKKFIINILIFAVLFFIYDKIFIIVMNYTSEKEIDRRLELLINGKINKDIIIIGSSRGARDVIAYQIENKTGKSVYNLSYPGSNIEFHEFLLKSLIKFNKPPKLILLVVDPTELKPDCSINFRSDRLYPLVKYNYIFQELVNRNEKNLLLSKFFILHRINKSNLDLRLKKFTPNDTLLPCGSMPVSFQIKGIKWKYKIDTIYKTGDEESTKVNSFKNFIYICKQNNIKLVLVFPPYYGTHNKFFENRLREISGNDACLYVYNTSNPIYINKDYFSDLAHLKRNGAEIFTNELILKIDSIFNKK